MPSASTGTLSGRSPSGDFFFGMCGDALERVGSNGPGHVIKNNKKHVL